MPWQGINSRHIVCGAEEEGGFEFFDDDIADFVPFPSAVAAVMRAAISRSIGAVEMYEPGGSARARFGATRSLSLPGAHRCRS